MEHIHEQYHDEVLSSTLFPKQDGQQKLSAQEKADVIHMNCLLEGRRIGVYQFRHDSTGCSRVDHDYIQPAESPFDLVGKCRD